MSDAIHPVISKLAKWVQAHGLRITSIVRPGPSKHSVGLAFDTAPWVASSTWGDRSKAVYFFRKLRPLSEGIPLAVVGEGTHIHTELAEEDFAGNMDDYRSRYMRDPQRGAFR